MSDDTTKQAQNEPTIYPCADCGKHDTRVPPPTDGAASVCPSCYRHACEKRQAYLEGYAAGNLAAHARTRGACMGCGHDKHFRNSCFAKECDCTHNYTVEQ